MSLGLIYHHQFLEADIQDQTKVTQKPGSSYNFLSDALYSYLKNYPSRPAVLKHDSELVSKNGKLKFRGDNLRFGRNEGFLWANEYDIREKCAKDDDESLRRCGYVYWDSWRLRTSGIINLE